MLRIARYLWFLVATTVASSNHDHQQILTTSTSQIPSILNLQEHDISFCKSSIPFCLLHQIRAGSQYDEYDSEEEEIYERPQRRPAKSKLSSPPLPPPPSSAKRNKKPKHWTQRMASQSMQFGGRLAWNTVKQPGKLAYHLIRPKHVEIRETGGLWRLDQQVTMKGDRQVASVASIELNPRKRLVILRQQKQQDERDETATTTTTTPTTAATNVIAEPYTFTKSRLGFYKTSFVAPAFLVGDKPRLYGYKGTWQRKVANTQIIKLVGKIYNVKRQRFGKGKGSYIFDGPSVGTFVARRRIQMEEEDDDESEEEEEDDGYDDEYDEDLDQEYDQDNHGGYDDDDDDDDLEEEEY